MVREKRRYLFEYADDAGLVLRESTLERFAGHTLRNLFITKGGSFCVLNDANLAIFNVYGESKDNAGNNIWVRQNLEEFYEKCMEYRKKLEVGKCNS